MTTNSPSPVGDVYNGPAVFEDDDDVAEPDVDGEAELEEEPDEDA